VPRTAGSTGFGGEIYICMYVYVYASEKVKDRVKKEIRCQEDVMEIAYEDFRLVFATTLLRWSWRRNIPTFLDMLF
jgi:hypothetical protein